MKKCRWNYLGRCINPWMLAKNGHKPFDCNEAFAFLCEGYEEVRRVE